MRIRKKKHDKISFRRKWEKCFHRVFDAHVSHNPIYGDVLLSAKPSSVVVGLGRPFPVFSHFSFPFGGGTLSGECRSSLPFNLRTPDPSRPFSTRMCVLSSSGLCRDWMRRWCHGLPSKSRVCLMIVTNLTLSLKHTLAPRKGHDLLPLILIAFERGECFEKCDAFNYLFLWIGILTFYGIRNWIRDIIKINVTWNKEKLYVIFIELFNNLLYEHTVHYLEWNFRVDKLMIYWF